MDYTANIDIKEPGMRKQCSLTSLPNDCWTIILEFLDAQEIHSASSTCEGLNCFFQPFLYQTISWEWSTVPLTNIIKLLRSILQNPELASYVQHVNFVSSPGAVYLQNWEKIRPELDWEKDAANYTDVIDQAKMIVGKANFSDAATWIEALQDGNAYAFMTMIISQLRNLKSLRFHFMFIWKSGFPEIMLSHAQSDASNSILSTFVCLETVDYGSNVPLAKLYNPIFDNFDDCDGYPPCNPDQFISWFHLPAIKSLSAWLRHFHQSILCLQDLHTLVLARSNMEAEDIHDLLAWKLPALKTLHLGLAYRFSEQLALDKGYYITWGLEAVSGSLENISLGIEYYPSNLGELDFGGCDELTREDSYGLFKRLPNLWSAEIPITLLLGFFPEDSIDFTDFLPNTLRELCLQWDNAGMRGTSWEFEKQLRGCVCDLLVDCRAHFPDLKRITLRIWNEAKDEHGDNERTELKNMCADAGIDLNIIYDELSPEPWTATW